MFIDTYIHLSHHLYDGEFSYIGRFKDGKDSVMWRGDREKVIKDIKNQEIVSEEVNNNFMVVEAYVLYMGL